MELIKRLKKQKLIHPPEWLDNNLAYCVLGGSRAYACNNPDSDYDYVGFATPPLTHVFPHLANEIRDFGSEKPRFGVWECDHHIIDPDSQKEVGFTVYSIVKFFDTLLKASPDKIDALFVPDNCIVHTTKVGTLVRENRKLFLNKKCWHTYKGYSFQQAKKLRTKKTEEGSTRHEDVQTHGLDTKYSYHLVRLLLEVEMILQEYDLDLQRHKEQLKSIRRGEWSKERVLDFFDSKEKSLEEIYDKSTIPYGPDEEKIKALLFQCLETHYGSLDKVMVLPDKYESALRQIQKICQENGIQ